MSPNSSAPRSGTSRAQVGVCAGQAQEKDSTAVPPLLSLAETRNRQRWLEIAAEDRARCAARKVFADRVRDTIAELGQEIGRQDVALILRMLAREAA